MVYVYHSSYSVLHYIINKLITQKSLFTFVCITIFQSLYLRFIIFAFPDKFNVSCVTDKIIGLGLPFENLTRNILKGDNFTTCDYDGLYKTPSDEYFT